jgi:hypothetical protein
VPYKACTSCVVRKTAHKAKHGTHTTQQERTHGGDGDDAPLEAALNDQVSKLSLQGSSSSFGATSLVHCK